MSVEGVGQTGEPMWWGGAGRPTDVEAAYDALLAACRAARLAHLPISGPPSALLVQLDAAIAAAEVAGAKVGVVLTAASSTR